MRVTVIAIYATFAVLVMASCSTNKGSFLLINKAKEPISQGEVTICGQTIEFKLTQPGKIKSGVYKVTSDSHFDIRIEFQSGKKLRKELGYVTNGFDFYHEIIVTDEDIKLMTTKPK